MLHDLSWSLAVCLGLRLALSKVRKRIERPFTELFVGFAQLLISDALNAAILNPSNLKLTTF